MIVVLGWSYFHSVSRRPHPKVFLLLKFSLRNLLWFWWVYLCYLFFPSYNLQYPFSTLCACFNDNMSWGSSIFVKSVWCAGGFLCQNGHSFL
jgi:hypothetical protein